MDLHRFDALTKALVSGLPRRRLLHRIGGGSLAALAALRGGDHLLAAQQEAEEGTLSFPCRPCNCDAAGRCGCCLIGLASGGVVQTEIGEAQLVLFATRLEEGAAQQGAGFVRWIDPDWEERELRLESFGSIVYEPVEDDEQAREIRGTMQANGEGRHPFVLRVVDFGPEGIGQDTAELTVGSQTAESDAAESFGYQAGGTLIGGDLQLLDSVGPVGLQ